MADINSELLLLESTYGEDIRNGIVNGLVKINDILSLHDCDPYRLASILSSIDDVNNEILDVKGSHQSLANSINASSNKTLPHIESGTATISIDAGRHNFNKNKSYSVDLGGGVTGSVPIRYWQQNVTLDETSVSFANAYSEIPVVVVSPVCVNNPDTIVQLGNRTQNMAYFHTFFSIALSGVSTNGFKACLGIAETFTEDNDSSFVARELSNVPSIKFSWVAVGR